MSEQDASGVRTGGERRSGLRDLASRLYRGDAGIDVVGRRKTWYLVAAVILLIGIFTIFTRGFTLGLEFKGGNAFTVPASVGSQADVADAVTAAGGTVVTAQTISSVGGKPSSYMVKTSKLDEDPAVAASKSTKIKQELAKKFNITEAQISESAVSGAWGAQVTQRAITGALVFLVLVAVYLAIALREWRMSVAAMVALLQNIVLTATVYALVGFEVTPSTIIGFLTILGFALYDVVVVFDRVRENTQGITGNPNLTYGEAANLAVNQTMMRSINTSVVALLPVGGLLFIGAGLLGVGTLKDLGLVLFVGMLAAVYSSIFFATPVLVDLKEQEPRFKLHKQRVLAKRAGVAAGPRGAAGVRASGGGTGSLAGGGANSGAAGSGSTATGSNGTGLARAEAAEDAASLTAQRAPARRPATRPSAGPKPGGGRASGGRKR